MKVGSISENGVTMRSTHMPATRSRRRALARLVPALLAALLACSLAPLRADAADIRRVGDILSAIGGTVYIHDNPDWSKGQYWADGAWHSFADLDPADKNTQDGPIAELDNGWKIYWAHSFNGNGGEYMIWRYPDNGQLGVNGSRWPGFKIRFNDIGYTAAGDPIDAVLDFEYVFAWQYDGSAAHPIREPSWLTPFEITRGYGPLTAASSQDQNAAPIGIDLEFDTALVHAGTDTPIDDSNEMDVLYWDIDQPVHQGPDGAVVNNYSSDWREGVHFVSGYKDPSTIGDTSELVVSDSNTWFRSGGNDSSPTPTDRSSVIGRTGPRFRTGWRGYACSTGIGYDTKVRVYPQWPAPVKSEPVQIVQRGGTATFDVTEVFPYVADSNKADSLTLTDTLDPALDASRASVTVLKGPAGDVDVTDNWTITTSGQTVTATAKNTGHGYAEGRHVFRITAPVRQDADLSARTTEDVDGTRYWPLPNQASMTVNNEAKPSNTVKALVPYEAEGEVRLQATKALTGAALQAGQFTFELRGANGDVISTAANEADGTVAFPEIPYTAADIGKTHSYTIVERDGGAPGYVYDTHAEAVTVTVSDAGGGVLNATASYDADGAVFSNEFRHALGVVKRSASDDALGGAVFTLYEDDGDGAHTAADPVATVYSDPQMTTEILGAEATTGADGTAVYHGLRASTTYWLEETRAPVGYNLDPRAHAITVSASGEVTTTDAAGAPAPLPLVDGTATITIVDEPLPVLPATSGPGAVLIVFAGSFLTAAGAGILLTRRSKRRASM